MTEPPAKTSKRQGPRPLPLHLATLTMTCGSSSSALALWNSGSLPWKPALAGQAAALASDLTGVDPDAFGAAVEAAARARMARFMDGVLLYRATEYRRDLPEPPVLWRQDNARLIDYGAELGPDAPVALVVPSLINRAFILDLDAKRSLLRYLAAAGVRPLLLDWGAPSDVERRFSLTDYIAGPLETALGIAAQAARGPVTLLGYCMGGTLVAASALRRPDLVRRVVMMAAPWDFHTDPDLARRMRAAGPIMKLWVDQLGELPVDMIQTLLYGLDPTLVLRKFDGLARHGEAEEKRRAAFAAVEDWLNDGVPLAGPVAEECLLGWYGANTPARLLWRVAGRIVDPAEITAPALVIVPAQDRIVPPASALALAQALPNAQVWEPAFGHIGMIVSTGAKAALWQKLAGWLLEA
jgi:polyhydroxyalkanoate synthase